MSGFVFLPCRLQLIGPGWVPDPLRANQILSWEFGLGSAKPWVLSLNVVGTEG